MIYTVTLNPAIDYFITLKDELMVDEVNRGTGELFKAGGKGLNVSKTLSVLGVSSKAVALLGDSPERLYVTNSKRMRISA